MTLILSGTDGLSDVDGSAATPAIKGTDANTGIFFPAADTVAMSTGGSERMRIDTSGNVGIGTSSPTQVLDVRGNILALVNGTSSVIAQSGDTTNYNALRLRQTTTESRLESLVAGTNTAAPLTFVVGGSERMRLDTSGNLLFNSGYGSVATAYGCRAWVNFNGTGTVAIRASGNVSSITDNGTGDYTVNFTTAMPDANYSVVGSAGTGAGGNDEFAVTTNFNQVPSTSAVRVGTSRAASGTFTDPAYTSISIFR